MKRVTRTRATKGNPIMQRVTRSRLLAGAAFGLGLTILAPQQAQAACNVTLVLGQTTVLCDSNTTTTNTTFPTNPPSDRNVDIIGTVFLDVEPGVVVDGFGLSLTHIVPLADTIPFFNDGTVQVNAGNTASAGGLDGALAFSGANASLVYSGVGDILNLGTGDGLEAAITGTGGVSATIGGSVRAEAGDAVRVSSTNAAGGSIGITTTAGETIRASGGDGMDIDTAGSGNVTVTNNAAISSGAVGVNTLQGGIDVNSTGTGGISITGNGAVGATGDRAQLAGITASINNVASNGSVGVTTGTGGIFTVGRGVDASTTGTGTVDVTIGTGGVDSTGIRAVSAVGTTGNVTVTTNGLVTATGAIGAGIRADSTTGAVSVTTNAGVTTTAPGSAPISMLSTTGTHTVQVNSAIAGDFGIFSNTAGNRSITIASGGSVDGNTQAAIQLVGGGTATIGNAGTIGSAPTDIAINAAAAGATTVTNSGVLNGSLVLGAGADSLTNTGTINTQGTLDFGGGADTLANNVGGTVNLTGATILANLETLTQAGTLNLNTFTLTGTGAFTNTGTIDTNGNAGLAGFTTFSNAGNLNLGPGVFNAPLGVPFTNTGTIFADEGASTITGQSTFANSNVIDLQDGVVDDALTIDSDFAGSGASSLMVDFDNTDSDQLVINGAASGSTAVDANFIGSGLINVDGVLVVDADSATTDAFILGDVTGSSPLVDVSLVQEGADFFLFAAPNASAFDPLAIPGLATSLWYQSADEVLAETHKPATTVGISFWGDAYFSRDKYGDDDDTVVIDGVPFDVDNELETKRHGLQLGVDYGFGGGRVGLTAGYAWAKADGNDLTDVGLKAKGWNLGLYGQFGGITGFHGEFLAKYDRYDGDFNDGAFDGVDFDIKEFGVDGSLGYRFGIGGDANVDASVGLSHVRTKVDDIDAFGFDYDIDRLTSTRGRAGIRATFGGGLAPYVDGTVYREFDGDGQIALFDGANTFDLDTDGKATWVRLEAGLKGNDGPGPILAAWGDLGDKKGFGLRAGWRLGGAVEAVAPPPPPPPAPPPPPPPQPPATQTCPDGSVILASDACPPPPPPPPPPPEPERG